MDLNNADYSESTSSDSGSELQDGLGDIDLNSIIDSAVESYFGGGKRQHRKRGLKNRIKESNRPTNEEDQTENEPPTAATSVPLDALNDAFEQNANNPIQYVIDLHDCRVKEFPRWCQLLDNGFGLILHGFGSKLMLVQEFCKVALHEAGCAYIELHGYKQDASIRKLLTAICENLKLDICPTKMSTVNYAELIVEKMQEQTSSDLVVVVHNIDGSSLRDDQSQSALFTLAQATNIRVIMTVDHINATLMWSQQKLTRSKFLFVDSTTYRPYNVEVLSGSSKLLGLSGHSGANSHTFASLESFWASLTQNAKRMFSLIVKAATIESSQSNQTTSIGISFWQLYRDCKSEFIVSSELQLQQQLVEFCDHNLVFQRKNDALGDRLTLNIDLDMIRTFLIQHGFGDEIDDAE